MTGPSSAGWRCSRACCTPSRTKVVSWLPSSAANAALPGPAVMRASAREPRPRPTARRPASLAAWARQRRARRRRQARRREARGRCRRQALGGPLGACLAGAVAGSGSGSLFEPETVACGRPGGRNAPAAASASLCTVGLAWMRALPSAAGCRACHGGRTVAASAVLTADRVRWAWRRCHRPACCRGVRGPGEPGWCAVSTAPDASPSCAPRARARAGAGMCGGCGAAAVRHVRAWRHCGAASCGRLRLGAALWRCCSCGNCSSVGSVDAPAVLSRSGRIGGFNGRRRGRGVAAGARDRGRQGRRRARCRRWPWRQPCRPCGVRRRGTACVRVGEAGTGRRPCRSMGVEGAAVLGSRVPARAGASCAICDAPARSSWTRSRAARRQHGRWRRLACQVGFGRARRLRAARSRSRGAGLRRRDHRRRPWAVGRRLGPRAPNDAPASPRPAWAGDSSRGAQRAAVRASAPSRHSLCTAASSLRRCSSRRLPGAAPGPAARSACAPRRRGSRAPAARARNCSTRASARLQLALLLADRLVQPLHEAAVAVQQLDRAAAAGARRASARRSRRGRPAAARPAAQAARSLPRPAAARPAPASRSAFGLVEQGVQGSCVIGDLVVRCPSGGAAARGCRPARRARACPAAAARSSAACRRTAVSSSASWPGCVGAELDQVARLVVAAPAAGAGGAPPPRARAVATLVITREIERLDVDGRVVAGLGQLARQHDVAVEDAARGVGDRVLLVVAFAQHGVEGGDRAARRAGRCRCARPAAAAWRSSSAGSPWWPAARRWPARSRAAPSRSASGDPSAAARAGRGRGSARRSRWRSWRPACAPAAARRPARPRRRERAQAFLAEDVLDELLDLAAALADQADHDHVGRGVARHHAQQHATCRRRCRRTGRCAGRGRR